MFVSIILISGYFTSKTVFKNFFGLASLTKLSWKGVLTSTAIALVAD